MALFIFAIDRAPLAIRFPNAFILERNERAAPGIDLDDDDYDGAIGGVTTSHLAEEDEDAIQGALDDDDDDSLEGAIPGVAASVNQGFDIARLEAVLQDLIACRQLLDMAMQDG